MKLTVLSEGKCEQLLNAAIKILGTTGADIKETPCREMLESAGCSMDGVRVRFPEVLIRESIEAAPSKVDIYDKEGNVTAVLSPDSDKTYYAPGICTIYRFDVETGKRRLAVKQDVFEAGLVEEELSNFTFSNGLAYSSDCPPELATAYEVQQLLMSTSKPFVPGGTSLMEQKAIIEMCAAVAGGMENLRRKPNLISVGAVAGPLDHNEENLKAMMYTFECGLPALYVAAPMIAATAPATIAGSMAVSLADNLVGLVLSQLVRKGNPYIGSCFIDLMDVRTMAFAHTSPEFTLGSIAMSDVFHYMGLPSLAHLGTTDSTTFDQQAAFDITSQLYSGMLSHVNVGMFSGFLETAITGSLEAVVFADEVIGHLRCIEHGVDISEDILGLDVIDELGPGGNYLGTEHTMDYYPEHWKPSLFVRQNWAAWSEAGAKSCGERANERVNEIIAKGVKKPLPEGTIADLREIMNRAEAELAAMKQ